jgi:cobalt/nickel transport system permease protein
VEGLATAGVVSFIWRARPEILERSMSKKNLDQVPVRNIIVAILAVTVLTGAILSWYASEHPDGLEWSIEKVTGTPEIETHNQPMHDTLGNVQEKTSLMPDYAFKQEGNGPEPSQTEIRKSTTVAGLFGGLLVFATGILMGFILKKRRSAP